MRHLRGSRCRAALGGLTSVVAGVSRLVVIGYVLRVTVDNPPSTNVWRWSMRGVSLRSLCTLHRWARVGKIAC